MTMKDNFWRNKNWYLFFLFLSVVGLIVSGYSLLNIGSNYDGWKLFNRIMWVTMFLLWIVRNWLSYNKRRKKELEVINK